MVKYKLIGKRLVQVGNLSRNAWGACILVVTLQSEELSENHFEAICGSFELISQKNIGAGNVQFKIKLCTTSTKITFRKGYSLYLVSNSEKGLTLEQRTENFSDKLQNLQIPSGGVPEFA